MGEDPPLRKVDITGSRGKTGNGCKEEPLVVRKSRHLDCDG